MKSTMACHSGRASVVSVSARDCSDEACLEPAHDEVLPERVGHRVDQLALLLEERPRRPPERLGVEDLDAADRLAATTTSARCARRSPGPVAARNGALDRDARQQAPVFATVGSASSNPRHTCRATRRSG